MQDLNLTVVQTPIDWQDKSANLARLDNLLEDLRGRTDLILLPEMFTTGFTMDPAPFAEPPGGPTYAWMAERAAETGAVVAGSLIVADDGVYYNRFVWMRPDGTHAAYDKRHLFAMAGEDAHYARGRERLVVELKGWRVCPLVCYDLRFPVWARNDDAYDLLVYVANWPDKRSYDWRTLLAARAIENQCFVAGVNRVGDDPNGHHYRGDSCVIDPGWRQVLWQQAEETAVHTETLPADHLHRVRQTLPFQLDRDAFTISP